MIERVWNGRKGSITASQLHLDLRSQFDYVEGTLQRKGKEIHKWNVDAYGYPGFRMSGIRIRLHVAVWLFHNSTLSKGLWLDHIDRDPLNNRIENLRLVTPSQNNSNRRLPKTGYKGVAKTKQGTWRVQIQKDRKVYWGGIYPTPEDAARAYNKLATAHFGECAVLNQIEGNQ